MNGFLDFLFAHKVELIELVVALISLIILICKKKVKIEDVFVGYLLALPGFIREAEIEGLSGDAKYKMVFSRSINYLMCVTGGSLEEITIKYASRINESIEDILNTPQKKGIVKDEKKNVI